ncbi:HlyD family secretion protein [Syntrophomonas wolfei]|uniref:Secretion protein HlyD n=1 Tax=Syntrophomonas wolfei subsp. wolfei (strain DSM 2245B / Goettingen) TaxID=335541 RepID=Q0B0H3_SYNWW|nr:efflux RND transporter periplasmic adaptor subunit [Syntrophomonas wolfei]ABI67531.1 secretion protein HlyD [Syntrophomonas wolfei subsp. wolfei str. Goettingen G311]
MARKKYAVIIFLVMLLLVAMGIFYAYFYQQQKALADRRESLAATGTIEAKTIMTSFKVPGRIETLLFDEGATVEKGQELAVLETQEIEARLLQAEGSCQAAEGLAGQAEKAVSLTSQTVEAKIAQAEANLTNYQQKFDRVKSLHESGAIADSQFDEAANALKAAQGQLDEARAGREKVEVAQQEHLAAVGKAQQAQGVLQEAQTAMNNTRLKSPISGYITQKVIEEGEMLNAGTPVFEISDLKHPYVKVFIDERKIGRVYLQQAVEVRVDAFPRKVFPGKVVWISDAGQFAVQKAINEQYSHDIRSFEVKIDLPNDDLALKTGMTASVQFAEGK